MKKRLLSLLLALVMAFGLAVSAAAAQDQSGLPEAGKVLHGFQVKERGTLELIGAPTVTLEHVKSGATVYYIAAEDINRTFTISFRTPALDERGMSHILEHSSLSGSEQYPSPNLFFAAMNQTYNTFVNAMTSETTTDYPVSSLSEDQLLKLADLYLDGVFHPMLYTDQRVFQREAWRYTMDSADGPLQLTGTVYNEMRGTVGISRVAQYNSLHTLFPNSIIGNNSGGAPSAIPELTWEDLVDYHKTYYVPSNALITLYGDLDLDRFLSFLDKEYLSEYDKTEVEIDRGACPPLDGLKTARYEFPAEQGADTERGAIAGYGISIYDTSMEERAALLILSDLLAHEASPVSKAVAAALPNASFTASTGLDYEQSYLMFEASGISEAQGDTFRKAVDQGLETLVRDGLDPELVEAVIADTQFSMRAITESSQQGPSLASMISKRWAAEGTTGYFNFYQDLLERLRADKDGDYFTHLVETFLVNNPSRALAVTVPVPGLQEQQAAERAQALADRKAAMSSAEITKLAEETAAFNTWSAQEAPQELVASLKAVSVKDLPQELIDYPISDRTSGGVRYLTVRTEATGLGATILGLDLSGLSTEDLPWVSLYASLLGKLDTAKHSAAELSNLQARYLGSFGVRASSLQRAESTQPILMLQWIGMPEEYNTSLGLAGEILLQTDFSDVAALKRAVAQLKTGARDLLNTMPDYMQQQRALAALNPEKYGVYDSMAGMNQYTFLDTVERQLVEHPEQVVSKLIGLRATLKNRQNALSIYAGDEAGIKIYEEAVKDFWAGRPQTTIARADRFSLTLPLQREGIVADTTVQYNLLAASLADVGLEDSGKLMVLANIVSDQYITPQMRHVLGAYGATVSMDKDGVILSTYRDPSVAGAYEVFSGTSEALKQISLTQDEIDGYIMSVYSGVTRPRGVLTGAINTVMYHLMGISTKDREEELGEMKTVTLADVRGLSEVFRLLNEKGIRSTVGSASSIEQNKSLFDQILYPIQSAN